MGNVETWLGWHRKKIFFNNPPTEHEECRQRDENTQDTREMEKKTVASEESGWPSAVITPRQAKTRGKNNYREKTVLSSDPNSHLREKH